MDDGCIPEDFPDDGMAPFALAGVQAKLNLTRAEDGRIHARGTEPGHRLRRYREAMAEVAMCVSVLQEKLLKPKYQSLSRDDILAMLKVNLTRDRCMTASESEWILRKVRTSSLLNWPRC